MNAAIAPIILGIETGAPPARAWAFITDPELVARWFADASPVGDVGEPYRIDFGDGSVVEGRIVELEPGRAFAHEWAWLEDEPGRPTLVRWRVEPVAEGGSRVELVHEGWTEAGADDAIRDDHEAYWSGYLDDLRDLLDEPPATAAGGAD
jgi:uncharacterized protein YndB with AHSA1/START domain